MMHNSKRLEWLRSLRRFKNGVKIRARLGVLQAVCDQVRSERRGHTAWQVPDWEQDKWVSFLYDCIKNNEYPIEILVAFAQTAEVTFFSQHKQPTVEATIEAMNKVCKQLSKPLRVKFGVLP